MRTLRPDEPQPAHPPKNLLAFPPSCCIPSYRASLRLHTPRHSFENSRQRRQPRRLPPFQLLRRFLELTAQPFALHDSRLERFGAVGAVELFDGLLEPLGFAIDLPQTLDLLLALFGRSALADQERLRFLERRLGGRGQAG